MKMKLQLQHLIYLTSPVLVSVIPSCQQGSENEEKPNILWLTSEDNSPFLGCYGDPYANTPNLDKLASEGILYTHAYANAPVCAPARSTIISGMYANSLGTENMRSTYAIPEFVRFYPYYLRKAGYYCTNNRKKDYNMPEPDSVWDESSKDAHYRNRAENQPFFAIFNFTITHESKIHDFDSITVHSWDSVFIAPYHPDVDTIRHDMAQYYDRVSTLDTLIGQYLKELEDAGLADNTIVFYYSDHGGVLARSKRFIYETGTHVPFIVKIPEKFKHLACSKPGTKSDRMISFVDLGPTLLSLTGIEIPEYMQGNAFLGNQKTKDPKYSFMFRGRMDERFDMVRAVRDEKFRYIRNFMPYRPWGQHIAYLWKAASARTWEHEYLAGNTNDVQNRFWGNKPVEELYDTENDPFEINNLVDDPEYSNKLSELREACFQHSIEIMDLGFIPEIQYEERFKEQPGYDLVREANIPIEKIIEMADKATSGNMDYIPEILKGLDNEDVTIQYWAIVGTIIQGKKIAEAKEKLLELLDHPSASIKIIAAESLYKLGLQEKAMEVLIQHLDEENPRLQLYVINILQMIEETNDGLISLMEDISKKGADYYIQRAAEYYLQSH